MSEKSRFQASVSVTTNKTLAAADQGIVQDVAADGITITLPATVVGLCFTIRNRGVAPSGTAAGMGLDGSVLVTVAPNASDLIQGLGFTAAANKAALNTKSTSIVGDYITLVANGTTGWNVLDSRGIWSRQS